MEFVFDRSKCVACGACILACIDNKNLNHICAIRELVRKESGTFPKINSESITISCFHCKDAKCVEKCPTGAMYYEEEFHTVQIDREKCINCHVCVAACPYNQIKIDENGKIVKCDFCIDELRKGKNPICVDACHTRCLNYQVSEGTALPNAISSPTIKNQTPDVTTSPTTDNQTADVNTSATMKNKISARSAEKTVNVNSFLDKNNNLKPQFYLRGDEK